MTELVVTTDTNNEKLTIKVEIGKTDSTTGDEMVVISSLSKVVNKILQDAQRRSSLKSDWQKQYELTGIDVQEPIQEE